MTKKIPPADVHLWLEHTKDVKRKKKTDKVADAPEPRKKPIERRPAPKRLLTKQPSLEPPQPLARKQLRRVKVEATLDLHDMNFEKANAALERFLLRAQERGIQQVLIITGKGALGSGQTLRSMLPYWLSETPLRNLVSYVHTPAKPQDGGAGAYYVGVKRAK